MSNRWKAIFYFALFGCLSVAIVVAGIFAGLILAALTPFILVFTGLGFVWFCAKDFSKDQPDSGSDEKD